MQIIIDTREQKELHFPKTFLYLVGTVREHLSVGDYAVRFSDGYVPPIRIERKSINDLFGTLGGGHDRFKHEIERAEQDKVLLLVCIENSITEVREGIEYTKRKGDTIIDVLTTLYVKYGLESYYFNSRSDMAYWIYKLFFAVGKLYITERLGFKSLTKKRLRELL